MKFRKFLILAGKKFSAAMQAFISWVLSDGGIVEAKRYVDGIFKTATNASILQIPSAYKAGVLYNQIPIIGDEIIVNGNFENGFTGWSVAEAGGTLTVDLFEGSNQAHFVRGASSNPYMTQPGVIGFSYVLECDVRIISGTAWFFGGAFIELSEGHNSVRFTATSALLYFQTNGGITDFYIDNVSVKQVQDFTVARASDVTRTNEQGVLEVLGSNVPCIDYSDGFPVLLTQPQSTNLYLNNETLSTQNVTTSAIPYTVSFYGTGTITFSGTHTGSLVGTGVNDRVQVTFTPTAGTLTSTVSGTVTKGQIEALSYATTPITTSGATATRLADVVTGAGSTSSINSEEGVLFMETAALENGTINRSVSISDGTLNNTVILRYRSSSNVIESRFLVGGVLVSGVQYGLTDRTDFSTIAFKWKLNDFEMYVDGVSVYTDGTGAVPAANVFNTLDFTNGIGSNPFYAKTKQLRVYSSIADAQIDLPYIT